MKPLLTLLFLFVLPGVSWSDDTPSGETIWIWPGPAPGESKQHSGTELARRPNESPPATRIKDISKPSLVAYQPEPSRRNGAAVIIAPGGGYNYVVVDKEGSEVAARLNRHGVACFVLRYRTKDQSETSKQDPSARPLQDIQRAIRLVRGRAKELQLNPNRIGVMGFSAGGQLAALATTRFDQPAYENLDALDGLSCRPDFAMLIYPWRLLDPKTGRLAPRFTVTDKTPPTLLIHAHNDSATPMSSIQFYTEMKKRNLPAELHIFASGGHGYGLRPVKGSNIHTWPDRAADWLRGRGLISN